MRRSPDQADSLPRLPTIVEFSNNPLAGIECIRRRIEKRMQALFVCGCRHELQLAASTPQLPIISPDAALCPHSVRIANPGCAHAGKTLQPDPFFTDVHRLVQLHVLDPQWHIMSEVLTHRITIFDGRVSRLAKSGQSVSLPNLQTDQQPLIAAVRQCGEALLQVLALQADHLRQTGSLVAGIKPPVELWETVKQ